MQQQPDPSSFESQYQRVCEAAECRTQVELADFLGVRQSSISDARRRQSIPAEWRMKLFAKKRVNPEWVLCGQGSKYLVPTDAEQGKPHVVRVTEVRPPRECSAQELVNELVRRALEPFDAEMTQEQIAATWGVMKKLSDKS